MNTAALVLLSIAISPALALAAHGATRESWRTVTLGALLTALALGLIRALTS